MLDIVSVRSTPFVGFLQIDDVDHFDDDNPLSSEMYW
jgi:hypothetical protein